MHFFWKSFTQRGQLLRLGADILLINFSLLLALMVRYLWLIAVEGTTLPARQLFMNYMDGYLRSAGVLTLLCVLFCTLSGFYSHGRAYRSRYKVLIIVQAISLSYVTFGALTYVFQGKIYLPRGAFVVAWLLTLGILILSRLWAQFWRNFTRHEEEKQAKDSAAEKPQNILLIGGGGYIGSALLGMLLQRGYRVRLLDLMLYGNDPIKDLVEHPNLEIMKADFRQVDKMVQAVKGMDAVVHLGGIVGDPACAFDEKLTVDVNLMATRMVAEVAKGSGIQRFVFASTCSVYGAGDEILNERSVLNPVSLYARSKIASEDVLRDLADKNFSPTCLRFSTIYGFSGRIRFDLVINLLTAKALIDKEITVHGGGQWRPFVHVEDAAASVLRALEAPLSVVHNETFNVGSNNQNYTIDQIAELIQKAIPDAKVIQMDNNADRRNYRVNFDKITRVLSFQPKWTVERGIEQVAQAIRLGQVSDYRDRKYSNFQFLREEGASLMVRSYTENLLAANGYEVRQKQEEGALDC
jgi:nucleoside-diphosphate-sugar epimerase